MNRSLIDNWNQCVDSKDQVFFLGDFGIGNVDDLHSICAQLKGHKICIRGNHDRNASWLMRIGFSIVLESAFLKISDFNKLLQISDIGYKILATSKHFSYHSFVNYF